MSKQNQISTITIMLLVVCLVAGGATGYLISSNNLLPKIDDYEAQISDLEDEIQVLESELDQEESFIELNITWVSRLTKTDRWRYVCELRIINQGICPITVSWVWFKDEYGVTGNYTEETFLGYQASYSMKCVDAFGFDEKPIECQMLCVVKLKGIQMMIPFEFDLLVPGNVILELIA